MSLFMRKIEFQSATCNTSYNHKRVSIRLSQLKRMDRKQREKKIIEKSSNTLRAKSFNLMRYMHDPIGSAFELDAMQSNFIVHQKFHQKFSSLCICVRVWHFKEEDLLRNSRSIGLFATSYKHLTNELLFILIFLPISNLKYCFKSKNKQTATNI